MFEPEGFSQSKKLLNEALLATGAIARERDLHQIALCQWIAGAFTLADSFTDSYGVTRELWLFVKPKSHEQDIAVELVRSNNGGMAMRCMWCSDLLSEGAMLRPSASAIRWANTILATQDQSDREVRP